MIENNLLEVLFKQFARNACEHQIGIGRMPKTMPEEYYPLVLNFSLYGIQSLLINWHNQNYVTAPEKMAEAYRYLLTNPLLKAEKGDSF